MWLAALAIFTSLISLYYYLQVIRQMYIHLAPGLLGGHGPGDEEHEEHGSWTHAPPPALPPEMVLSPSALMVVVVIVNLIGVFWLGVYPAPLLEAIEAASKAIMIGP